MKAKEHFVQGEITNDRSCIPNKRLKLLKRLENQKIEDTELHKIYLKCFTHSYQTSCSVDQLWLHL